LTLSDFQILPVLMQELRWSIRRYLYR
jgi:hypothetical protein